ncbi:hypothetical protein [Streptomyces albidoflavus]|uniref:hypothetical protein n=1 Tax=Streptomyces albidoflavus TaxID=1886 RepID=UPI001F0C0407|nr:hypothetical protein [Streptomyces albidoflavus]
MGHQGGTSPDDVGREVVEAGDDRVDDAGGGGGLVAQAAQDLRGLRVADGGADETGPPGRPPLPRLCGEFAQGVGGGDDQAADVVEQ